jgi:cobalt-zinc-cadmium efflux system protein
VRTNVETVLLSEYELEHTTLQVDDADGQRDDAEHCIQPHGPVHRSP